MDLIETDFVIEEDLLNEIRENWVFQHFDEQQRDTFIKTLHDREIKYCLETGFCTGSSSATVLATIKPEKMISVGMAFNNMEVATKLTNQYNFKLVVGDSTQILNKEFMDEEFPNGIDFYHVDGGHEGLVPLLDLQACVDHLNDNFLIIVDDYHSKTCPLPDVDAGVDAFIQLTKFKMEPIVTESGKGMAFITKE